MANYKDIELSNGIEVRVYAPPTLKLSDTLMKRYPDPAMPVVESEPTVTGKTIKMVIEDDPDYLEALAQVNALRDDKLGELSTLYALKDVKIPEGWDIEKEQGELIRLADPDWVPRTGKQGVKLDYIEWELLANTGDVLLVQRTIAELAGIDLQEVDRIEDSFRGNVEGSED